MQSEDLSPVEKFYHDLPKLTEEFNSKVRKTTRYYFTSITQEAIIAFNAEEDQALRNKIYNDQIHKPLWKLANRS